KTESVPSFGLFEQHSGATDLLTAEGGKEIRDQAVHELEVRRQRGHVLRRGIEHLFPMRLGMHRRPGAAVDEHELRTKHVAFAIHELTLVIHLPPSESV